MKKTCLLLILGFYSLASLAQQWSKEKAAKWYQKQGWLVGANYTPAYAVNQLEFWQAETFDPAAIDKELGYAEGIGMNCMRVFLHHVAWEEDKAGFKGRMRKYLTVAAKHHIKTLFVFFDDCWNDSYKKGLQAIPVPGKHNSGWLRDPGTVIEKDEVLMKVLEAYVKDVMGTFKKDKRIFMWDLYNEPGNHNAPEKSLPLLHNVFKWAREIRPSQPVTAGIWNERLQEFVAFQAENSDVVTFHCYGKPKEQQDRIDQLKVYKRPVICTEYMARKFGSTFEAVLPMFKAQHIGAISWGLVDGKTNTKYAWDDVIADGGEPKLWFHEIFRKDGTPYDPKETALIKSLTAGN